MSAPADATIAELERTVAELRRTLAKSRSAYAERIEHQAATNDVLQTMSASPGDPQPVFDLICRQARRLLDVANVGLFEFDGARVHYRADSGSADLLDAQAYRTYRAAYPMAPMRSSMTCRAILDGKIIHVPDLSKDPELSALIRRLGHRSQISVPLMRDGRAIGALSTASMRVDDFSDSQIALLQTFAEQAVIAISGAETYRALQTRTRELSARDEENRALIARQAASIEVLKAISASPDDAQPVLDLIVRRARELANAQTANLVEYDGNLMRQRAWDGYDPDTWAQLLAQFPRPPGPETGPGRVILSGTILHRPDADQGIFEPGRGLGLRATLGMPLLREGQVIGVLMLGRFDAGPFDQSAIELVQAFAEQAVIALSSAAVLRALRESTADLQQSLEYQTATSDVLKVISRSTFDLQPVLDTVVETAARLCNADQASMGLREGDLWRFVASHGFPQEYETHNRAMGAIPLNRTSPSVGWRSIREARTIHVHDAAAVPGYGDIPVHLGKQHTSLGVPLLREDVVVGNIMLARRRIEPFTERQIDLVNTFAAQAVIAMENARLLTEQQEALERQTAMAEVLQVINASPGDLAPVFDIIGAKAIRLCDAAFGAIMLPDGERFRAVALGGVPEAYAEYCRTSPDYGLPTPGSLPGRMLAGADVVHVRDAADASAYPVNRAATNALVELAGGRTLLGVALRKDSALLGMITIFRQEARPFSDRQIELLRGFAGQVVIAMENARLITEQREALERQTATAEVLGVINANPGDLAPVFDTILDKAHQLCGAAIGSLTTYDGEYMRVVATRGYPKDIVALVREPYLRSTSAAADRLIGGERYVQVHDVRALPRSVARTAFMIDKTDVRTGLMIPLRKDGVFIGQITAFRSEVRPFADNEISLLESFAAQAVIAMENARLLTEQREALEQQTATAEVLQVINASPGQLRPVFDAMVERAKRLCEADYGSLWIRDGTQFHAIVVSDLPPEFVEFHQTPLDPVPGTGAYPLLMGESVIHISNLGEDEGYLAHNYAKRALYDLGGARTVLFVALRKEASLLGFFMLYRRDVRPFSARQINLLRSFSAQAVIAMENARLIDEIRRSQEELRVTFENMGDGVAMFDPGQHLVAWNRKFQEILDVPDEALAERQSYDDYIRYLTARGEFGANADPAEQIRRLRALGDRQVTVERSRPNGRVIEVRQNPIPDGGFVLIYADITERKRNEAAIAAARDAAEEASRTIEAAYRELKTAQANLVQAEKMASLGQLTAGIAHEIKNPLNFVNNFAALSTELIDELRDVLAPETLGDSVRAEVDDLTTLLKGNLDKVVQHGKRADGIVKSMLEHSRGESGERRMVDINALADEALNLAYHGARAQDQSFNITLERDFAPGIAPIEVNPQDMTRVFLNLFSNGFYAANKRARNGADAGFAPALKVTTRDAGDAVEIRVRDNGTGIPDDIREMLFQPFFTTKPTGEGTGLGLSITYDIVTKQHGGTIAVDSAVGDHTTFLITLPRQMFPAEGPVA